MVKSNKKVSLLNILYSGFRHRFLVLFRPRYVITSLLKRKGRCLGEGHCCLINKPWCRYFNDGKCQIYVRQPFFCEIFPIDEKDKKMSGVNKGCGYYWDSDNPAD